MKWNILESVADLENLKQVSQQQKILIYKHSNRCSICSTALERLEKNWQEADSKTLKPYFIDVVAQRPISNQVAKDFNIRHESPQVLIIENGVCKYQSSHLGIHYQKVIDYATSNA